MNNVFLTAILVQNGVTADLKTEFGSSLSFEIYFDCDILFSLAKHVTKMKKKTRYTYLNDYIITLCTQ